MATKTRAQMIDRVLERLGVKAVGQDVRAEEGDLVGGLLDSYHDQLLKRGLVNFDTSAFPMWAQSAFTKLLAGHVAAEFGITGQRLQEFKLEAAEGERELAQQMQAKVHPHAIKADYF